MIWNERRRLQREKRLGLTRGKHPPVVEKQQSSLTEPNFYIYIQANKKNRPFIVGQRAASSVEKRSNLNGGPCNGKI
ncbi:MAG: hypothetical protein ACE3JN_05455 [Ectobacillus sp.]